MKLFTNLLDCAQINLTRNRAGFDTYLHYRLHNIPLYTTNYKDFITINQTTFLHNLYILYLSIVTKLLSSYQLLLIFCELCNVLELCIGTVVCIVPVVGHTPPAFTRTVMTRVSQQLSPAAGGG